MATTPSPIVNGLLDETVGKIRDVWNKGSDAVDKVLGKKPEYDADSDDVQKATDSFKPQSVGKKALTKPSPGAAKPTTVAAKAAPRKKI